MSDRPPRTGQITLRIDEPLTLEKPSGARQPVLVVLSGEDVGRRYRVPGSCVVGRDPECDIPLLDSNVSWRHARLEDRGGVWAIVDLGSTNGTTVNGERVTEKELAPNDRVGFGREITRFEVVDAEDAALGEELERLIHTDDLTGLYVRRRFDAELRARIERTPKQGVGLLVMDLDGVKQINDTHGHLAGGYVIGRAGRILGEVVGARGIAARFGGDEFVAALAGLDLEAATRVGEEVRIAIAATEFLHAGLALTVTISVGCAAYPQSARDASELFQRADEALYRAKQSGRNRVCR